MQDYIERLNLLLMEDRFQIIPTDIDTVYMYGRIKNNQLYLINIIDMQKNLVISLEQYEAYKKITEEQFIRQGFERIFLLNIFVISNGKMVDKDFLETVPNYNSNLVDFHWVLDLDNKLLMIPKEQPKKYANVENMIKSIIEDNQYKTKKNIQYKTDKTTMTYGLIIINVIIWVCININQTANNVLINFGALQPISVLEKNQYYRMITAMFLHIDFTHLFYNMFSLYIFGTRLEKITGRYRFIGIYLFSGLGGNLLSYIVSLLRCNVIISIGASGAIYGLQGAALYITMITKDSFEGISEGLLGVMIVSGLIFGFTANNIDNMAHLGGLITGYIIVKYSKIIYKTVSQSKYKNFI